jgi:hypothetical protein
MDNSRTVELTRDGEEPLVVTAADWAWVNVFRGGRGEGISLPLESSSYVETETAGAFADGIVSILRQFGDDWTFLGGPDVAPHRLRLMHGIIDYCRRGSFTIRMAGE